MFKIAICDDELLQREELKGYIYKVFEEVKEELELLIFKSAEDVLKEKDILKDTDIFILDIKMDEVSGMDLAKIIRKENDISEIIFITSLVDYIQEGYIVRAYRYLLKPINYEELKTHLLSCINDIKRKKGNFIIIENKSIVNKVPIN
ncbi:LytR/AlgR family response regulator transcription factor, partial [Peptacetobacter sp.]|uniref:LytR/AlgR family response regulator transcription factor n=1 Tax=Peptacetobacter sp. TaxID=2991975 RepID=UPI002629DE1D